MAHNWDTYGFHSLLPPSHEDSGRCNHWAGPSRFQHDDKGYCHIHWCQCHTLHLWSRVHRCTCHSAPRCHRYLHSDSWCWHRDPCTAHSVFLQSSKQERVTHGILSGSGSLQNGDISLARDRTVVRFMMCICACVSICVCTCVRVCDISVCTSMCICVCYIHMCDDVYECMCVHVCVDACMCMYVPVYMCEWMYAHVHICVHLFLYVHECVRVHSLHYNIIKMCLIRKYHPHRVLQFISASPAA